MSIVGKPENIPSAVILTLGNKVVLYCTVILPLVAERSQTRRHGVGDQEVAAGHQFFRHCCLWRIILSTRVGAALNFGSSMLLLGIHVFLCTITTRPLVTLPSSHPAPVRPVSREEDNFWGMTYNECCDNPRLQSCESFDRGHDMKKTTLTFI